MTKVAMILAAGFGTRMGKLTRDRPKPLLEVRGRALIDHALDLAIDAEIGRAVVNLHYRGEQIRTYLQGRPRPEILFSEEEPDILDTGGGIVHALPALGRDPFFTLNSDAIFAGPNPCRVLAESWDPARMDALLLLVTTRDARAYQRTGDFFLDREGTTPRRRGMSSSAPFIYSGAQIIAPTAFTDAPRGPFSMNVIWDRLLASGRLAAVTYPGAWVDVGTPEGLIEADRALAAQCR